MLPNIGVIRNFLHHRPAFPSGSSLGFSYWSNGWKAVVPWKNVWMKLVIASMVVNKKY
jgi:hypothetical protein